MGDIEPLPPTSPRALYQGTTFSRAENSPHSMGFSPCFYLRGTSCSLGEAVTFLISHKSVGVDGEGGCRSKGIPPPPRHLPCPLTTILSLSATLSFLSSR